MLVGNIHQILFFLCQLYYSILGYSLHSIVPSLFSVCMLLSFMLCLFIYVLYYLCRTIALVATVICWPYPTLNKLYLILSFYLILSCWIFTHCAFSFLHCRPDIVHSFRCTFVNFVQTISSSKPEAMSLYWPNTQKGPSATRVFWICYSPQSALPVSLEMTCIMNRMW